MRNIFIMLVLLGLSMAFTVKPDYFETKDTGNQNLDTMEVGITLDCDSKLLTATVTANDTGQPVPDSPLYLFYTDYGYQLIGNGRTGSDGKGTMDVVGNMDYLTAMFILRADNPQFRSKEIEFGYEKCFEGPPANVTPPANHTPKPPPQNATPPANGSNANNSNVNGTNNQTTGGDGGQGNGTNQTGQNNSQPIAPPPEQRGNACLPAFLLAIIAIPAILKKR